MPTVTPEGGQAACLRVPSLTPPPPVFAPPTSSHLPAPFLPSLPRFVLNSLKSNFFPPNFYLSPKQHYTNNKGRGKNHPQCHRPVASTASLPLLPSGLSRHKAGYNFPQNCGFLSAFLDPQMDSGAQGSISTLPPLCLLACGSEIVSSAFVISSETHLWLSQNTHIPTFLSSVKRVLKLQPPCKETSCSF